MRAKELMLQYASLSQYGRVALLPDLGEESVIAPLTATDREALTAEYGPPTTIDRGELSYWQTRDPEVVQALLDES